MPPYISQDNAAFTHYHIFLGTSHLLVFLRYFLLEVDACLSCIDNVGAIQSDCGVRPSEMASACLSNAW